MKILQVSLVILTFLAYPIDAYKILAIFPFSGKSHQLVLQQVGISLASKGHQVDVVSHYQLKRPVPNYTNIIHITNVEPPQFADYEYLTTPEKFDILRPMVEEFCSILEHPVLQKLLRSEKIKPSYDAVIVHYLMGIQCFTALGHLWSIPVIGVVTTSPYPKMSRFVEQPLNLALYPSGSFRSVNPKMTFWDRLYNVWMTHRELYEVSQVIDDEQDRQLRKYFGSSVPHFSVLEKTGTSLLLSSSHYSFSGVKPKSPAVIEIGGIHIKNDTATLDENLKRFLDQSGHGFIYLSFGTLVRIETFPDEILHILYEAIRKVSPVRVVVRVAKPEEMPKNWPKNSFVHKWLPQQLILQHPKIRGFVTHGGAHGIQEGLNYAVPMICVPFFADQGLNCDLVVMKKLGLQLDFETARQEDYDRAFEQILTNPVYGENVRKVSAVYRDRPRAPSDEAVYWVEYVVRHGKNVLKSPGAGHLEWWQTELLDVYGFILACALLTLCVAALTARLMFVRLRTLAMKLSPGKIKFANKKLN